MIVISCCSQVNACFSQLNVSYWDIFKYLGHWYFAYGFKKVECYLCGFTRRNLLKEILSFLIKNDNINLIDYKFVRDEIFIIR